MGTMRKMARQIVMARARTQAEQSNVKSQGKFRRFVFKNDWSSTKYSRAKHDWPVK